MTTIEIYPVCDKPEWVKIGAWCHVLGEGNDIFTISAIVYNDKAVVLVDNGGYGHGIESITKCYQDLAELNRRRENKLLLHKNTNETTI